MSVRQYRPTTVGPMSELTLEEWKKTYSVAVDYACECGGRVRFYEYDGDATLLKCFECGEIGIVKPGLIRKQLDGLQRI